MIRVGSRHNIHLYEADTAIGTMLTPEWAHRVVAAVNANEGIIVTFPSPDDTPPADSVSRVCFEICDANTGSPDLKDRLQLSLSALNARGAGHGYRLTGPKFLNDSTALVTVDLDDRDVREIRRYLGIWDKIRAGRVPPGAPTGAGPEVVTICGSMTLYHHMLDVAALHSGSPPHRIILMPFGTYYDGETADYGSHQHRARLDALHRAKIDMSSGIFVVYNGLPIGDSTAAEVAYATSRGKTVRYVHCGLRHKHSSGCIGYCMSEAPRVDPPCRTNDREVED